MPHRRSLIIRLALGAACAAILAAPIPHVRAQTRLVSATPGPDTVVTLPPAEVRLVFDHPLLSEGTSMRVSDKNGKQVDKGSAHIDPRSRTELVAPLPILFEGEYSVTYTAATVGSSTILTGRYTFTLDLPSPVLELTIPANGQSFERGPVPVRLDAKFVNFDYYNTRVRLYVDGQLYREWAGLRASVDGLAPGVHELRTVLVQFDNQELPETVTTITIAVARPDPDRAGLISPPTPPVHLSPGQIAGLVALTLGLFAAGFWLGRAVHP